MASLLLTWLASSATYGPAGFSFTGRQADYYNLLAAGFLIRQVGTDAEPKRHPEQADRRNHGRARDQPWRAAKQFFETFAEGWLTGVFQWL